MVPKNIIVSMSKKTISLSALNVPAHEGFRLKENLPVFTINGPAYVEDRYAETSGNLFRMEQEKRKIFHYLLLERPIKQVKDTINSNLESLANFLFRPVLMVPYTSINFQKTTHGTKSITVLMETEISPETFKILSSKTKAIFETLSKGPVFKEVITLPVKVNADLNQFIKAVFDAEEVLFKKQMGEDYTPDMKFSIEELSKGIEYLCSNEENYKELLFLILLLEENFFQNKALSELEG